MQQKRRIDWKTYMLTGAMAAGIAAIGAASWGYDGTPDRGPSYTDTCFDNVPEEGAVTDNPCNAYNDNIVIKHDVGFEIYGDLAEELTTYAAESFEIPTAEAYSPGFNAAIQGGAAITAINSANAAMNSGGSITTEEAVVAVGTGVAIGVGVPLGTIGYLNWRDKRR